MGLIATPGSVAYMAAKHGVVGLTKAAALEYAADGIRVNSVCPGYINTPLVRPLFDNYANMEETIISRHPVGRLGEPQEIAEAVVWAVVTSRQLRHRPQHGGGWRVRGAVGLSYWRH